MEPCLSQPAPTGGWRLPAVLALQKWGGTSEGRQHALQCERQYREKLLAMEVAEAGPARALPPTLGSPGFVTVWGNLLFQQAHWLMLMSQAGGPTVRF